MPAPDAMTITYPEFLARFAPEVPRVPVFRTLGTGTVEAYLPGWIAPERLETLRQHWQEDFPDHALAVYLVTDVPREQLFGDWRTHMPEEAAP